MRLSVFAVHARRRFPATLAVLTLAATTLAQSGGQKTRPVTDLDLAQQHAFLRNVSSWQQHVTQAENKKVDKSNRGVFPVGNGYVFGYHGLGRRANTIQELTGPLYQTATEFAPKGHFGEATIDLLEGGTTVALPQQSVWRTRGVNVVITRDASPDGLSLMTVSFASGSGKKALYRIVEVHNAGSGPRAVAARVDWERGKAGGKVLTAMDPGKGFVAELAASVPASANGNKLTIDLGSIPAGGAKSFVLTLRTAHKGAGFDSEVADAAGAARALTGCHDFWQKRLAGTATLACDRTDIADLVEDWKILMLVQRSEPNGAVAPMINHRGSWIRDTNGALIAFLRYGLLDEARDLLDFTYYAAIESGKLSASYPLDLDIVSGKRKESKVSWGDIRFPATELPTWVILQHEWYYRASDDIQLIKRHWPYLLACLNAIRPDTKVTLPTRGDEPYLAGAFFSLFPDRVPDPCYLPADGPGRRARSFEDTVLYMMSFNAMAELVEGIERYDAGDAAKAKNWGSRRRGEYDQTHYTILQKIDDAFWLPEQNMYAPFLSGITGEPYTAPYGPVSLLMQWIGFTYAFGDKNKLTLKSSLDKLWTKGARVGMTPTVGYSTGDLQGLLVYALADLDDRRRNDALDELVAMAAPGGEWGEIYDPNGHPVASYDAEWPNRLCPNESGINVDAILFALNGIRYVTSPGWSHKDQRIKLRLPNRGRWMAMRDLRHDGHHFDIFCDEQYVKDLELDETGAPTRKLRFHLEYHDINRDACLLADDGTAYVDADVSLGDQLYIRYPSLDTPATETTKWPVDAQELFPAQTGPGKWQPTLQAGKPVETIVLTKRRGVPTPSDSRVIDIGLPMRASDLAGLLIGSDDKGKKTLATKRVVLDVGVRDADYSTFKTRRFWRAVDAVLGEFRQLGGTVIETTTIENFQVVGPFFTTGLRDLKKDTGVERPDRFRSGSFTGAKGTVRWRQGRPGPTLDLRKTFGPEAGQRFAAYASAIVDAPKNGEYILRVGADDGLRIWINGKLTVEQNKKRLFAPDQYQILIRLNKGENRLLFKVLSTGGPARLSARVTDFDGLPIAGLRYR